MKRLRIYAWLLLICCCAALAGNGSVGAAEGAVTLTGLNFSTKVLAKSEAVTAQAALTAEGAELPQQISITLRDISDDQAIGQVWQMQLERTDARSTNARTGSYAGSLRFPEEIKRTRGLTAVSWSYLDEQGQSISQAIEGISNAWFFVLPKAADADYVQPTLAPSPTAGYSLRLAENKPSLSRIEAELQEDKSILLTAQGVHLPEEELYFTWVNGAHQIRIAVPYIGEQTWQVAFTMNALPGKYRLTRIEYASDGERLKNYPDTYLQLQGVSSKQPNVKVSSVKVHIVNAKMQASVALTGELEGITRLSLDWILTDSQGNQVGSGLTTTDTRTGSTWTSQYAPAAGGQGTWSIMGVRVWYQSGWQVVFDDQDFFKAMDGGVEYGYASEEIDIPTYARLERVGETGLVYFSFADYQELWQSGDIVLEFESRREPWVLDVANRQVIVAHPLADMFYYMDAFVAGETEATRFYPAR